MNNTTIQMDLLSEARTPHQVLNYAINRERGQANQQEILRAKSTSSWNPVSYIRQNRRTLQPMLPTSQTGKIEPCWKCDNPFIPNHLQNFPAKNTICKICKKQGLFSSMCKAPMPESRRQPQQSRLIHKTDTRVASLLEQATIKQEQYVTSKTIRSNS